MAEFDEAAFLKVERLRHRPVVRMVAFIGIAVLLLYILSGPLFAPSGNMVLYNSALMIAAIAAYVAVVNSAFYLRVWWIDAPFFVIIFCAQLNVNRAFFSFSEELQTTPQALVLYNAVTFVITMIVGIAASFKSFAIAAVVVVLICAAYVYQFFGSWITYTVQLAPLLTALALTLWANHAIYAKSREAWTIAHELAAQKANTEKLLFNVLPEAVAERLRRGDTVADAFGEVSVIFIDLVGFSQLSRTLAPRHLVEVLNSFFMLADRCAERNEIEKVKTIGDAYLAVSGASIPHANCAADAITFAVDLMQELKANPPMTGLELEVRVGVHTGAVVGGVIGTSRMAYDYWGDTVNLASRIQAAAEPGSILVSESTYYRAQGYFHWSPPRLEVLKGIGETKVYPILSQ